MRILVVDGHALYLRTLCEFLETLPEISVCASALDGQEVAKQGRKLKPDVVLAELKLPKLGGFRLCERLRESLPQLGTVVYTEGPLDYHKGRRPECVDFFVSKDAIFEELPAYLSELQP